MASTSLVIDRPPERVFAVLSDPWRFADWVVGAKEIRAVDATWPAVGSRFHHRFGAGPFTIDDSTVLEAIDPPERLVLRARARPAGVARVELQLVALAGGATEVQMDERPVAGVAERIDNPVLEAFVAARNRRSLRRLAALVEQPVP